MPVVTITKEVKVTQICKRDGSVVPFNPGKIQQAIYKALSATEVGDSEFAAQLASRAVEILRERIGKGIPSGPGSAKQTLLSSAVPALTRVSGLKTW